MPNLDQASSVDSPKKQARNLWVLWLGLALLVIVALFCFGQLALMAPPDMQAGDMHSGLKADYSLWPPLSFKPLEPALIEELINENPALPTQMLVIGAYWSTTVPTDTPVFAPSATSIAPPAAPPAALPAATATFIPLRPQPTRRLQPANTKESNPPTPLPPSATKPPPSPTQPTNTPRPTQTYTPSVPPTRTYTATFTATSTNTQPATATFTPTATIPKSATATATATATRSLPPNATNTNTPTSTKAPFPTAARTPLPDGVNLGLPDSRYSNILCGSPVIIDLGAPTQIGTLIFYEYRNQNPVGCANGICLNWVMIDLSDTGEPWPTPWPRRVFFWGDNKGTNNGSLPPSYFPTTIETSNLVIPSTDLYNGHGIQIHVDGVYRYIYVAPPSCSNYAQLDSIEIWSATITPRP
jgi:hypothetical protein